MLSTGDDVNHHDDGTGIPLKSEEIGEFIRRGRAAQEAVDEILEPKMCDKRFGPGTHACALRLGHAGPCDPKLRAKPEAALALVRDAVKDARINIESAVFYTNGMRFDLVRALVPGLELLKSVLEGGERAIALQIAWETERAALMESGDDVAGETFEAPPQ